MTRVKMEFPKTWKEYEGYYGFKDEEEVYTNGSRLIPSFRVQQWLDHLEQEPKIDMESEEIKSLQKRAYLEGFHDALKMSVKQEPIDDVLDKNKWLIEQYESEIEKCAEDRRNMPMSPTQAYLTAKIGVYGKVVADLKELIESGGDDE